MILKIQSLLFVFLLVLVSCGQSFPDSGPIKDIENGDRVVIPENLFDNNSPDKSLQLYGIACYRVFDPDLVKSYFGVLAKEFSEEWFEREVMVDYPYIDGTGQLDLNVGWVKDANTGEYLHESILEAGLAQVDTQTWPLTLEQQRALEQIQQKARLAGRGLWGKRVPAAGEMQDFVFAARAPWGRFIKFFSRPKNLTARPNPLFAQSNQAPQQAAPVVRSVVSAPKQVVPVVPAAPKVSQQSFVPSQNAIDLVKSIHTQANQARQKYLSWLSLSETRRKAQASALRQQLRNVKIDVMDALDNTAINLDEAQKGFLQSLSEDMSRLMRLVTSS